MENQRRAELLAPAGDMAGFYGAVHAGADAVYLAGKQFGARAYAENFTEEELLECIRYGHLMGRRIYLTVNTLLKDPELDGLCAYLAPFCEAGLDAAIVQDLGVLRVLRAHFPGLRLHVSTQMGICSGWGASLLKELGAGRIIPARELCLQEAAAMWRSGIEVETFVHGAMCYCYSGQCLFSSILGGRSGNRGRCAQPCRLPYSVKMGEGHSMESRHSMEELHSMGGAECHPLSLKDMCAIQHIPLLVEAGIDSFKIEGRMKRPEYSAGVTGIYRHYIDYYYGLRESVGPQEAQRAYHIKREDQEALASLYVRDGLQDGYYFRHSGRDMVAMDSPAYRESDERLLAKIQERHLSGRLRLPVKVRASFRVGRPARVELAMEEEHSWGTVSAATEAEPVERAIRQPITEENVRTQLCKLGDSAFYAEEIQISMDPDCFYPLKQLNGLRRMAVAELEKQILAYRGYRAVGQGVAQESPADSLAGTDQEAHHGYAFYVRTEAQLRALADWIAENPLDIPWRLYVEGDLLIGEYPEVPALCRRLSGGGTLFAALPYILREPDRERLELLDRIVRESGIFRGYLARSMDGIGFWRKMEDEHSGLSCRTDVGVYAWNLSSLEELSSLAEGFCLPYELNASEQNRLLEKSAERGLTGRLSCEKIIYSRIPMMITANCLRKTMGRCMGQKSGDGGRRGYEEVLFLRDRYRKAFPVLTDCRRCMNILYNSVPFSLHQEAARWRGRADLRMDFSLESPEEVSRLLDAFLKGAAFPGKERTTGHEKRGVL